MCVPLLSKSNALAEVETKGFIALAINQRHKRKIICLVQIGKTFHE